MRRPRPKLSCIVHRSLCGSFCRQLRRSRSDVIAQEPDLLPNYIKKSTSKLFLTVIFAKVIQFLIMRGVYDMPYFSGKELGISKAMIIFGLKKIEGKKLGPL